MSQGIDARRIGDKQQALAAQCPAPIRLPEEEAAKLPIHVNRAGAHGTPVVIVHGGIQGGIGGGPATFTKQLELGNRGWQIRAVDRPGFGESPSRGVDDMNTDAIWISDMLEDGAHLIGHSWGGAESLLAAARRPTAVRSLILVEPALQLLAATDPLVLQDPVAKKALGSFLEPMMAASTPRDYAYGFVKMLGASGESMDVDLNSFDDKTWTDYGCALLQGQMATPQEFRAAAEAVANAKIPVLVISGGWNDGVELLAQMAARATHAELMKIPSSSHFVQLDNPEMFNDVVDRFMREHDQVQS